MPETELDLHTIHLVFRNLMYIFNINFISIPITVFYFALRSILNWHCMFSAYTMSLFKIDWKWNTVIGIYCIYCIIFIFYNQLIDRNQKIKKHIKLFFQNMILLNEYYQLLLMLFIHPMRCDIYFVLTIMFSSYVVTCELTMK